MRGMTEPISSPPISSPAIVAAGTWDSIAAAGSAYHEFPNGERNGGRDTC
jgi:hypothetical protein